MLIQLFSWLLSGTTIAVMWLMGNKTKWGPALGIINVVLWSIYCVITGQYAFLVLQALYLVTHSRNLHKWWSEEE